MTQEDKELLLKDLCGRLPYGVKFKLGENNFYTIKGIDLIITDEGNWEYVVTAKNIEAIEIKYIKPYLRPMSSMTEDELSEYEKANDLDTLDSSETLRENMKAKARVRISKWYHGTDWLNAHHFDYRNLIEKGLAIAVTENNNPYEN